MATKITSIPGVTNVYVRTNPESSYVGVWDNVKVHVRVYDKQSGMYFRFDAQSTEVLILQTPFPSAEGWKDVAEGTHIHKGALTGARILLKSNRAIVGTWHLSNVETDKDYYVNKGGDIYVN